MGECMNFPATVEEFMEQYKVTDYKQVYTNGTELVPIFRMKQWFEHQPAANVALIKTLQEKLSELKYQLDCYTPHIEYYNGYISALHSMELILATMKKESGS